MTINYLSLLSWIRQSGEFLPSSFSRYSQRRSPFPSFFFRRLQKAIKNLDKAVQINPQYVSAHVLMGQIYQSLGYNEKARIHLQTALKYEQEGAIAEAAREMLKKPRKKSSGDTDE
ncbi:MAG: tetratricopeptide repeat protein [Acidobacteriota bacterium]